MSTKQGLRPERTRDLTAIALMAALMAVCAWITVPIFVVPFTLQTFAVFTALALLGGRRGTAAIALYLCLGLVGLPVFSGFSGGVGALLSPSGGYLLGFLGTGLVYWGVSARLPDRPWGRVLALALGLGVCYAFGTVWFVAVYSQPTTVWAALAMCVLPFVVPDLVKLALALGVSGRVERAVQL